MREMTSKYIGTDRSCVFVSETDQNEIGLFILTGWDCKIRMSQVSGDYGVDWNGSFFIQPEMKEYKSIFLLMKRALIY